MGPARAFRWFAVANLCVVCGCSAFNLSRPVASRSQPTDPYRDSARQLLADASKLADQGDMDGALELVNRVNSFPKFESAGQANVQSVSKAKRSRVTKPRSYSFLKGYKSGEPTPVAKKPVRGNPFQRASDDRLTAKSPDAGRATSKPNSKTGRVAEHDVETLRLINDELQGASPEERRAVFEYLKGVDQNMVRLILKTRRRVQQIGQNPVGQSEIELDSSQGVAGAGANSVQFGQYQNDPMLTRNGSRNLKAPDPRRQQLPTGMGNVDPWGQSLSITNTNQALPSNSVQVGTIQPGGAGAGRTLQHRMGPFGGTTRTNGSVPVDRRGSIAHPSQLSGHSTGVVNAGQRTLGPGYAGGETGQQIIPVQAQSQGLPGQAQWPEQFPNNRIPVNSNPAGQNPAGQNPPRTTVENGPPGFGLFKKSPLEKYFGTKPQPDRNDAARNGNQGSGFPGATTLSGIKNALGYPSRRDENSVNTAAVSTVDASGRPVHWSNHLQTLIPQAESQVAQLAVGKTEAEMQRYIEEHVHLRLMYLMAGFDERAMQPIPNLEPADQEFWQQTIFAVWNYFDVKGMPNRADRATQTITQLRSAVLRLQENAKLELRNLAFCHKISSYGNYERFQRDEFSPGQPVLVYAEVENFKSEPTSDSQYRTILQSTIEIYQAGPNGRLVDRITFASTEDVCRNPRRDYFHSYEITVPQRISLGPHVLKLTVEDQLSKKLATYSLNFTVR